MIISNLCRLHQTHRSNSLDIFIFLNFVNNFCQGWVGATLQKSKFGQHRFLGHKLWVVPWSSIYAAAAMYILIYQMCQEFCQVLCFLPPSWGAVQAGGRQQRAAGGSCRRRKRKKTGANVTTSNAVNKFTNVKTSFYLEHV